MEQERNYCVYKHTTPSGKVYIGLTKQEPKRRWRNGLGYANNQYFTNAINKYGWENIRSEIIKDNINRKTACDLEVKHIKLNSSSDPKKGYNLRLGGDSGYGHSAETKLKIAKKARSRIVTEETRLKMSESQIKRHKENPPSFETRLKISKANKGKVRTEETKRKLKERVFTEETKKNMSLARKKWNKNNKVSKETKIKMSKSRIEWLKHNDFSEETRLKLSMAHKGKVINPVAIDKQIQTKREKGLIKVSEDSIKEIRFIYKNFRVVPSDVAKQFNLSTKTIWEIAKNRTYVYENYNQNDIAVKILKLKNGWVVKEYEHISQIMKDDKVSREKVKRNLAMTQGNPKYMYAKMNEWENTEE